MKKLLTVFAVTMALFTLLAFGVSADEVNHVTVTLNGETVDCASYGQEATIVEGRTLVPLRAIFEAIGASVEWDQTTKTVTSTLDETTIKLTIGENVLYKNSTSVELDVPAQIMNGRTMVPVRAVSEAFGVNVEWDKETRTVILELVQEHTRGIIENGVYESEWLGLTFTLPDGYTFTSDERLLEIMGAEDVSDINSLEVDSVKQYYEFQAVGNDGGNINLTLEKNKDGIDKELYLATSYISLDNMCVEYEKLNEYVFEYADLLFAASEISLENDGEKIYLQIAVAEKGDYLVCLAFYYPNSTILDKMVQNIGLIDEEQTEETEPVFGETVCFDEFLKAVEKMEPKTELDKEILIKAGDVEISAAEVRYAVFASMGATGDAEEQKKQQEDYYLLSSAVTDIAKKENLQIDSVYIDMAKQYRDYYIGMFGEEYENVVYNTGYTPYLYYKFLGYGEFNSLVYEKYLEDESIVNAVAGMTADKMQKNDYVRAKHILVTFDNYDSNEEALEKAKEILNLVNANPEKFDEYVSLYSEDPGSKAYPGGYCFTYGEMVEPFEKMSFALSEGAISGIVETSYGYHIIKRVPIYSDGLLESNITYTNMYYDVAGEYISEKIIEGFDAELEYADNYEERCAAFYAEANEIYGAKG